MRTRYVAYLDLDDELSASSVKASAFTAADRQAEVLTASYYPSERQIKLELVSDTDIENTIISVNSSSLEKVTGESLVIDTETVALARNNVDNGVVAVQDIWYQIGASPITDVSGNKNIDAYVRVVNATGREVSVTVKLYDGQTLCGQQTATVMDDGYAQVVVPGGDHIFADNDNIRIVLEK